MATYDKFGNPIYPNDPIGDPGIPPTPGGYIGPTGTFIPLPGNVSIGQPTPGGTIGQPTPIPTTNQPVPTTVSLPNWTIISETFDTQKVGIGAVCYRIVVERNDLTGENRTRRIIIPCPPSFNDPVAPVVNEPQPVIEYIIETEQATNSNCEIFETVYLVENIREPSGVYRRGTKFVHPVGANQYSTVVISENPRFIGYNAECLANKQTTTPSSPSDPTPVVFPPIPPVPPVPPVQGGNNGGGTTVPPTNGGGTTIPTTPVPPNVTGLVYSRFDPSNDIINDRTYYETYGAWTDLTASLYDFYTSSLQTSTQKQYYYNVFQSASSACGTDVQFSVAYGNKTGSGSLATSGNTSISPSKAIYSQTRLLCLDQDDTTFSFKSGSSTFDSDHVYVISFDRDKMNDKLDPGNWQLSLAKLTGDSYSNSSYTGSVVEQDNGSTVVFTLIDDSGDSTDAANGITSNVYNVVSGSITNGIYNADYGWGLVYPDLGTIVLNADKLNGMLAFNTVTGSNTNGDNAYKIFTSISASAKTNGAGRIAAPFIARNSKAKTTTYFFANVKTGTFNFSNNPTYTTGSQGQFKFRSFESDPKVYITSIGLYNDRYELLAVGKVSQPIQKSFFNQTTIRVKLNY